jgi:hypothetical protein
MLAELGLHAILNLDLLQKVLTFVQDHSDYINGHFTDLIHDIRQKYTCTVHSILFNER